MQHTNNKQINTYRPFGLTIGEARFVMILSPEVKWRTKKAVETAYMTLLFAEMQENLAKLRLKCGYGIWEMVDY